MKITKKRLQEIIREEFKRLNEGPAYDYARENGNIESAKLKLDKAINDLSKKLKKNKLNKEASFLVKKWDSLDGDLDDLLDSIFCISEMLSGFLPCFISPLFFSIKLSTILFTSSSATLFLCSAIKSHVLKYSLVSGLDKNPPLPICFLLIFIYLQYN